MNFENRGKGGVRKLGKEISIAAKKVREWVNQQLRHRRLMLHEKQEGMMGCVNHEANTGG